VERVSKKELKERTKMIAASTANGQVPTVSTTTKKRRGRRWLPRLQLELQLELQLHKFSNANKNNK
jgi:hypothetical protein